MEELEKASWVKDAFRAVGMDKKGGPTQPTPPPESLFNLNKERSIKTIHLRKDKRQPPKGVSSPMRKSGNGMVNLTTSDGDSASSSGDEGLRSAAANKDSNVLALSDEVNGQAPGTTGGG